MAANFHQRIVTRPYKGTDHPIIDCEDPGWEYRHSSTLPSSVLDGGGWSKPCSSRFTPLLRGRPGTHCIGGSRPKSVQ